MSKIWRVLLTLGAILLWGCGDSARHQNQVRYTNPDSVRRELYRRENEALHQQDSVQCKLFAAIPQGLYTDTHTGEYLLVGIPEAFVLYAPRRGAEWQGLWMNEYLVRSDSFAVMFGNGNWHRLQFQNSGQNIRCTNPDGSVQVFQRQANEHWKRLFVLFGYSNTSPVQDENVALRQSHGMAWREGRNLYLKTTGEPLVLTSSEHNYGHHPETKRQYYFQRYNQVGNYSVLQWMGYEIGGTMIFFHSSGRNQYSFDSESTPSGRRLASVGIYPVGSIVPYFRVSELRQDTFITVFEPQAYIAAATSEFENPSGYQGPLYDRAKWLSEDTLIILAKRADFRESVEVAPVPSYPTMLVHQNGTWVFRPCWLAE